MANRTQWFRNSKVEDIAMLWPVSEKEVASGPPLLLYGGEGLESGYKFRDPCQIQ